MLVLSESDVVPSIKEVGYQICIEPDDDVDYKIVAKSGECTLTLPRIGRFDDPC